MNPSVIDYIGRFHTGILTNIGIVKDEKYYSGIFFYTEKEMLITMDSEFMKDHGDIQDDPEYLTTLEKLINMVDPFEKIYDTLDEYKHNDTGINP